MKKLSQISPLVVPPFEPCANCTNGWVQYIVEEGEAAGLPHARRCACFKAHAQRVADALKAQGKR